MSSIGGIIKMPLGAPCCRQVALVDRGLVPMVDKVKLLQAAGAVAVVIIDDGESAPARTMN